MSTVNFKHMCFLVTIALIKNQTLHSLGIGTGSFCVADENSTTETPMHTQGDLQHYELVQPNMTVGTLCFASLYSVELKGFHSMQALVVQWKNTRLPRGRPGSDSRPMHMLPLPWFVYIHYLSF